MSRTSPAGDRAGRLPGGTKARHLRWWGLILLVHVAMAAWFMADRAPGSRAALDGFPLDDAWILMVYGRSVAHHALPYYNPGALEAGFTSVLGVLAAALAELTSWAFHLPIAPVVKLFGTLFAFLGSVILFEVVLGVTAVLPAALAAALLAAAAPAQGFAQVSGMEVSLAAALSLLGCAAVYRRRHLLAGVALAAAYLTRPECGVFWAGALAAVAWEQRRAWRTRAFRSSLLAIALPPLVAIAAWAAFCIAVTGHPLPNTFYAKFSDHAPIRSGLHALAAIVPGLAVNRHLAGVALYAVGAVWLFRRDRRGAICFVALPWLFITAVAATRLLPADTPTNFYWLRYVAPALPLLFVPLGCGVAALWNAKGEGWPRRLPAGRLAALALLWVAVAAYPGDLVRRADLFAWNCQNMNEVQVQSGRWIRNHVQQDAAVVVNDAGASRYWGERRTIDLIGLNDHELTFDVPLHVRISRDPRTLFEFMTRRGASHLIIFPTWFPRLVRAPGFSRYFRPVRVLRSPHYTLTAAPHNRIVIYRRRTVPLAWSQGLPGAPPPR